MADVAEPGRLEDLAASVVTQVEVWILEGLAHDVALALAQNALPLAEGIPAVGGVQRRAHARVLIALLLLLDDPAAGDLATALMEVLREETRQERVLAS